MERVKGISWIGIIGPVLFVLIFTLEGIFRPGYNPNSMFISALSLGSRGWIQITNFMIFGTLLFLFAWGITPKFSEVKPKRFGPILLMIIAICLLLSGPFVMDPIGTPQDAVTWHGFLHGIFGAIVFITVPISIFIFYAAIRKMEDWHVFRWWTLGFAIIVTIVDLLFTVIQKVPTSIPVLYNEWLGMIQRLVLIPFFVWLCIFSIKFRISELQ